MRIRTIAISASALVATLGLLACGAGSHTKGDVTGKAGASAPAASSSPAAPKIATGKVGDTITLTSGDNKVEITVGAPSQWKGTEFNKPEKGAAFTVFKVSVNVVSGQYAAMPIDFHLVAADGSRYDRAYGAPDSEFVGANLVAGQKLAGSMSFDVPAAVLAGAEIDIDGTGLDSFSTAGIWKL